MVKKWSYYQTNLYRVPFSYRSCYFQKYNSPEKAASLNLKEQKDFILEAKREHGKSCGRKQDEYEHAREWSCRKMKNMWNLVSGECYGAAF